MNDKYILNEFGNPVKCHDLITWGKWYQRADRNIAADEFEGVRISTVFLAVDYRWNDGPPLLYETMIFNGPRDGYQERYSTKQEALEGHRRAVILAMEAFGE